VVLPSATAASQLMYLSLPAIYYAQGLPC